MNTLSKSPPALKPANPGAAWIHRFLLPLLHRNLSASTALDCLQLWPDDATEAVELERLGHRCVMLEPQSATLDAANESFDFVFTGCFAARAGEHDSRVLLAREIHRVLKPGGAILLVLKNRLFPIHLGRSSISLRQAKRIFQRESGFDSITVLSPLRHFAWRRAPALARPLIRVLELFWSIAETRPSLYNSIFNPTLILWVTRK